MTGLIEKIIKKERKESKILVLIDWENLQLGFIRQGGDFFHEGHFEYFLERLTEIGEVIFVFVFAPLHLESSYLEMFHKRGFYHIACPRIATKNGGVKDTTDEKIINFGKEAISQLSGLTHLCLVSGDRDLAELGYFAKRHGLKIIIGAPNINSISGEMVNLASIDENKRKMVFLFSESTKQKKL